LEQYLLTQGKWDFDALLFFHALQCCPKQVIQLLNEDDNADKIKTDIEAALYDYRVNPESKDLHGHWNLRKSVRGVLSESQFISLESFIIVYCIKEHFNTKNTIEALLKHNNIEFTVEEKKKKDKKEKKKKEEKEAAL